MSDENTESLRDALESSFEAATETVEQVESAPVEPAATESYEKPKAEEPKAEEPVKEVEPEKTEKVAKKDGITPGPKAGQPKEERAPQAWKPEAREHWKDIPEAARREILRTEQTIQQTLRETVEERRLAQAVKDTIRPFEHFIKAEGSNPVQAIDNLLTTAARLRTGNVNEVAQMVSQMVAQFGTGRFGNSFIQALDSTLAGQAPQQQVDPYVAQMQQRLNQMESYFQNQQQQTQYQTDNAAQTEIAQFQGEAEFLEDVRADMADMLDMAANRGQSMTLKEAYDRACWANPDVRQVIEQRRDRERAQQKNQVAQTARRAAVSVGGSPAFNANQENANSLRDAIEMAMRK